MPGQSPSRDSSGRIPAWVAENPLGVEREGEAFGNALEEKLTQLFWVHIPERARAPRVHRQAGALHASGGASEGARGVCIGRRARWTHRVEPREGPEAYA